ncbi:uncharacterized protein [Clytia hemisphaerica]|uniref:uncharacterized protein n=1 Tax=Clytia hemisphaerica TaxID=252671 RepID=UPI0034D56408
MEDKTEQRELLKKLYYSFDHPSAYSSAYSLYREAKKHSKDVSFKDVKKWLSKELAYTLHRPVRRKFKTRRVMDTRRYVDVLQELVRKYNNTVHRSIKMKPSDVTEGNSPQVWINLYGETKTEKRKPKKPKFNIGDLVRISVERGPFRKGYLEGWSEEIFVVKVTVTGGSVVVYKLMDQNNEELKGTFYTEELQKVLLPSSFRIERIIRKKRQKGGKTLLFVKWSGYPDTFNSYIEEDDLISGSR